MGLHSGIKWVALALWSLTVMGADQQWAHYRGPNYDGIVQSSSINSENLKEVWKASVGIGFSSIIVVNGIAYTMGNLAGQDQVIALDAKTGQVKWRHSYPCALDPNLYEGGPNATPTYADGKIYSLSKEGHIFCLNAKTGEVIWSSHAKKFSDPPTWGFSGAATILDDMVVFNIGKSGLALNKDSGEVVWKSAKGKAGYAPAVPFKRNNQTVFAMFTGTELTLVEAKTGKKAWSFPWKTGYDVNAASPVIFDDKIYITSGYKRGGTLLAFNGDKPKQLWENTHLKAQFNSPIYYKGFIYGISGDANRRAKLVCLDPANGEVKWQQNVRFGSMILSADLLVILDERGKLSFVAAKPDGYELMVEKEVMEARCWTVPALVDGLLYLRDAEGTVLCLDVR